MPLSYTVSHPHRLAIAKGVVAAPEVNNNFVGLAEQGTLSYRKPPQKPPCRPARCCRSLDSPNSDGRNPAARRCELRSNTLHHGSR